MIRVAINGIEIDKNIISKLVIKEDVTKRRIFPEIKCIFQETEGIFSEQSPIVHGSIFTLFRIEDNAREDFKIVEVKNVSIENMTDENGAKFRTFEIKGIYVNKNRNLYNLGTIINRTSSAISVLKDVVENNLGMRFVSDLEDDRNYDYYTFKVNIYTQLRMLIKQVNDSWRDKNAILYYTLFSNTITLADVSRLLLPKNVITSLTEKTTLSDSVVNDYSIPNKKSISGYDFDEERFVNYEVDVYKDKMNIDTDEVIYSNMIDEDLNNSIDFYLNNNAVEKIMNFNNFEYNLGKGIELIYDNAVNSNYVSTNKMRNGIYCIIGRVLTISSQGRGKQSIILANPFLNKNK